MAQKQLRGTAYVSNWSSLAGALEGVTRFFGLPHDTIDVMGLSGLAFSLALPADGGLLMAGRVLPDAAVTSRFRLLGLEWELYQDEALDPRGRDEAHRAVRRAIDKGSPAVAFGLFLPEFGLVIGYDDKAGQFLVSTQLDEQGRAALPFDRWPIPERPAPVCVLWSPRKAKVDRRAALTTALRNAVSLATESAAAYESWAAAMESGAPASGPGNASALQVVHTSRFRAAAFLDRAGGELRLGLAEASAAYREAGLQLSRLGTLFPYPNGGEIDDDFLRGQAARMLRAAAERELAAGGIVGSAVGDR